MNRHSGIILFTIIIIATLIAAIPVFAEEIPPASPDMALYAINLMAIQCQNLSDFSAQASIGDFSAFESVNAGFKAEVSNFDYLIGSFAPQIIAEFRSVQQTLKPSAESAAAAANRCQELRTQTYQKMMQYNGILNPPSDINSFEACRQAGYFINGNTCFTDGYFVFDDNNYLVGLYNANCFDPENAYYATCWYCRFGNNENGCNDSPGY